MNIKSAISEIYVFLCFLLLVFMLFKIADYQLNKKDIKQCLKDSRCEVVNGKPMFKKIGADNE